MSHLICIYTTLLSLNAQYEIAWTKRYLKFYRCIFGTLRVNLPLVVGDNVVLYIFASHILPLETPFTQVQTF